MKKNVPVCLGAAVCLLAGSAVARSPVVGWVDDDGSFHRSASQPARVQAGQTISARHDGSVSGWVEEPVASYRAVAYRVPAYRPSERQQFSAPRALAGDAVSSKRVGEWQRMMRNNRRQDDRQKLETVNRFFNQVPYRSDQHLWNAEDHWSTPVETLSANGADCEDYAIGKYVSLRKMGVPDKDLKLTYVNAAHTKEPHMVLTYQPPGAAEPLVLDNTTNAIRPMSERSDLKPVYSFNRHHAWSHDANGEARPLARGAESLKKWQEVKARL